MECGPLCRVIHRSEGESRQSLGSGYGNDELLRINLVVGSNRNDVVQGDGKTKLLIGLGGNDTIRGGGGNDAVAYMFSGPVAVDLEYGLATGEGIDKLSQIEALFGSDYNDSISGGQGPDTLVGSLGNDVLDGRGGENYLAGGAGTDVCDNGPILFECEEASDPEPAPVPPAPSDPPGDTVPPSSENRNEFPRRFAEGSGSSSVNWNLSCHPWSGTYTIAFPGAWSGWGYFAVRFDYGAFGPWVTSPWGYSDGVNYWWYDGQYQYITQYQTFYVGSNRIVDAYWWGQGTGWIFMGRCLTYEMHLIPGLTIVPR
jgi:hypothetical protein